MVSTYCYLMVFVRTVKDARCKTKIRDILMPQRRFVRAKVSLSLSKQLGEPSEK